MRVLRDWWWQIFVRDATASFASTMFGGALWYGLSLWLEFVPSWGLAFFMAALSFVAFLVWVALDFILYHREEARKP